MMFERLSQHCSEYFVRWNAIDEHRIHDADRVDALLSRKVARDGHFYLLTRFAVPDQPPLTRRIAAVHPGYDNESYYMNIVGEGRPEARSHNQPFNGGHGPLRKAL